MVHGNKLIYGDDRSQALRPWSDAEKEDKTYVKEPAETCDLAQAYLLYGQWVRPPAINAPTVTVSLGHDSYKKEYAMPAVLGAAYINSRNQTLMIS